MKSIVLKVFIFYFLNQDDTNQRLNLHLKQGKGKLEATLISVMGKTRPLILCGTILNLESLLLLLLVGIQHGFVLGQLVIQQYVFIKKNYKAENTELHRKESAWFKPKENA